MKDTGMTTMTVKKINKNKVYSFIYTEKTTCKLNITQALQMGLSTVSQNLKLLEEEGLIRKNGVFDSTGGRKADAIEIVRDAKYSIGVGILKKVVYIVATDLYGDIIHTYTCPLIFETNKQYYKNVGNCIDTFIQNNKMSPDDILGVSIATQGIISKDGESVSYGVILDNTSTKLSDFKEFISFPCRLEHDSKAAAHLEVWRNKKIQNAVVFLLNYNLGGAIISNGIVQQGDHMRTGTIEHLCIDPNGPTCYCGKKGCLESYCSAKSLETALHTNIPDFFIMLNQKDEQAITIWHEYLDYLAKAITNLSVVIDGKYIISGYLAPYFSESDIIYILEKINTNSTFPIERDDLVISSNGQYTQAIGTSLYYIDRYLKQI